MEPSPNPEGGGHGTLSYAHSSIMDELSVDNFILFYSFSAVVATPGLISPKPTLLNLKGHMLS